MKNDKVINEDNNIFIKNESVIDDKKNIDDVFKKLLFINKLQNFDSILFEDFNYLKVLNEQLKDYKELNKKYFVDIKNKVKKSIISDYFKVNNSYNDYNNLLNEIKYLGKNELSEKMYSDIIEGYKPYQELKTHEDRIKNMFLKQFNIEDLNDVKLVVNENKGVNPGYIMKTLKGDYYIKTFSNDSRLNTKGKIDPCELLVYKIMEYTGFGPETWFLMEAGSSESGSMSVHNGNYIVTKSLNTNNSVFVLDLLTNKDKFHNLDNSEEFALEIQSAAAIRDILSVWDTFNVNLKNYGVLMSMYIKNSFESTKYSPRLRLNEEFNTLNYKKDKEISPLVELAIKSKEKFATDDLKKSLYNKLFDNDDKKSDLLKAIDKSYEEVLFLIKNYGVNFVQNADEVLLSYIKNINTNISTFKKCMSLDIFDKQIFNNYFKDESEVKEYSLQKTNMELINKEIKISEIDYKIDTSNIHDIIVNNSISLENVNQEYDVSIAGKNDLEND